MHRLPLFAFLLIFATPLAAQIPGDVSLESAFGGENFSAPVALRHAGDGSGRKFVVERAGSVRIVDNRGLNADHAVFDSFADRSTSGEGGLLGLAFHPDYASNGRFYVYYTWNNGTRPDQPHFRVHRRRRP